jgi:hypothetical protein
MYLRSFTAPSVPQQSSLDQLLIRDDVTSTDELTALIWARITRSMYAKLRIIARLPLTELWRDDGFSTAERGRSLHREEVRQLLSTGPVQFVLADVGEPPQWIPLGQSFHFWKDEVKPHLADDSRARLDEFVGGYCYFASQWEPRRTGVPIVVLEKHH